MEHKKIRRRLRSAIAARVLRTLLTEVAAPILIAELYELARRKSLMDIFRNRKPALYIYLYRLAERGLVNLDGRRRYRTVVLTKEGERALEEFDEHYDTLELTGMQFPQFTLGVHKRMPQLEHRVDRSVSRRKNVHKMSGGRWLFYISYDVPRELEYERQILQLALAKFGFKMLHESMYVSSGGVAKVIEVAESIGLLPFLAWGKIQPLAA